MAYIVPIDIPECCYECPFHAPLQESPVGKGLYRKISHCLFSSEEIEDPWRSLDWMLNNKEEWCPLKEVND